MLRKADLSVVQGLVEGSFSVFGIVDDYQMTQKTRHHDNIPGCLHERRG